MPTRGRDARRRDRLPLPGPVIGIVLLFAGLVANRRVPKELATVADTLLNNMSLLFVPAGVGVMLHGSLLGREWLPISVATVASTALTIVVTGALMTRLSGGEARDSAAPGEGETR